MVRSRRAALVGAALLCSGPASPAAATDVEAGPIWNNADGTAKCPKVCTDHGKRWNGNWHTTVWGRMSVCNCDDVDPSAAPVSALPGDAGRDGRTCGASLRDP